MAYILKVQLIPGPQEDLVCVWVLLFWKSDLPKSPLISSCYDLGEFLLKVFVLASVYTYIYDVYGQTLKQ